MDYRLIIFDFDGTLVDSFDWFVGILDDVAARHRFHRPERAELEALRGADARTIVRRLRVPWWRLPAIARDCRRRAARDIERLQLFNGVVPMLEDLTAAGAVLAVVSTNAHDNVTRALGPSARLITHFDCGRGLFRKRAGLRRVLLRAEVAPHQAIYIGDEIRDCHAARAVSMAFGAASWGFTRRDALAALEPELLFEHVAEIAPLLVR